MKWVLLAAAIACEITGSLSLQAASGRNASPWMILVVVGYLASFVLLARVLALHVPVGVAYGIWGASGVALTAVLAHFLFDGPLNFVMAVGIALIIGGVVAVEVGAQRALDRGNGGAASSAGPSA